MPIDKVASTPGNPVFGLSPESLPAYAGVRSKPFIVDGPPLPAVTKNPNLKYVYNPLLSNVFDPMGNEMNPNPKGLLTDWYRPTGLLYKPPARVNA